MSTGGTTAIVPAVVDHIMNIVESTVRRISHVVLVRAPILPPPHGATSSRLDLRGHSRPRLALIAAAQAETKIHGRAGIATLIVLVSETADLR